ncbi:MAG: RnfABCDGE type electron transport complex subunit D [bacterium]|jgi:electron transport complex protein RnfD
MARLTVSAAPHIRAADTTARIMLDVVIALLPAAVAAAVLFGPQAIFLIVLTVAAAVVTEAAVQKLQGRPVTVSDWSAVVTGMLLAYNLPPRAPWWLALAGAVIAIAIVKHAFGGLGHNFMNPALAARAIMLTAWPASMTAWLEPGTDAVSAATPLTVLKAGAAGAELPSLAEVFIGNIGGSIGEVSSLALLIGAAYLLWRRIISWRIPLSFIGTVGVMTWIFSGPELFQGYWLYHILLGGVILGAFYMATDYSSSPITPLGQLIMGAGCGFITVLIRIYGAYSEGTSFAILIMNTATPVIDKYTMPRIYGTGRKKTRPEPVGGQPKASPARSV